MALATIIAAKDGESARPGPLGLGALPPPLAHAIPMAAQAADTRAWISFNASWADSAAPSCQALI